MTASRRLVGLDPASQPTWRRRYAARLVLSDLLVLSWAVFGAAVVTVDTRELLVLTPIFGDFVPNYAVVAVFLIGLWMVALSLTESRHARVVGAGGVEYRAVLDSGGLVLVFVAITSFALKIEYSRAFVFLCIPVATTALLLSRLAWRRWLLVHRRHGAFSSRVLLVGSAGSVAGIAGEFRRFPEAGYLVVGLLVTGGGSVPAAVTRLGLSVVGRGADDLAEAIARTGADTVVITDGHDISPERLRELSWTLEAGRQELVMAPSLTDVAGPRVRARPVAGLPLVHVETPNYEGVDRYLKRALDVTLSSVILLIGALPLLAVAVAVAATSPGGVFYRQERIGKNGRPFWILKFRTMVPDADTMLAGLLEQQERGDRPLFKVDQDPRITRVGRVLRRLSIDEIPQLWNVLRGEMSLVGPRPQVAREVEFYDHAASRRLFVKPGMTGLWQVSGRSNLDWEESVRLDLYYVENWSVAYDVSIMARTVRAVLARDGAE
jgi:exopolysaccharide biosynthesis polyprenyl glycosylphosphotransferase